MDSLEKTIRDYIKTKKEQQWFDGENWHNNFPNIGTYAKDLEKYTLNLESLLIDELGVVADKIKGKARTGQEIQHIMVKADDDECSYSDRYKGKFLEALDEKWVRLDDVLGLLVEDSKERK